MKIWIRPQSLSGNLVELLPLDKSYREDLLLAASDGSLETLWFTSVPSEETIDAYLDTALWQGDNGMGQAYVVLDKNTNTVIGTTRYCNADSLHRRLEIGYTWYSKSHQKTGVNTECKYLLLRHAFEELNTIAVEFRTHWHNHDSRQAILKLGAKQDGILRNHRIEKDGSLRDTVVFSITQSEWQSVKKSLLYRMSKYKNISDGNI